MHFDNTIFYLKSQSDKKPIICYTYQMIITKQGTNFIKLQAGDTIVAVNPVSKNSKEKTSKFGADIALISLNHEDFNGVEEASFGGKFPFVISGPGEYEVKGVFVKGFGGKSNYGGEEEKINTVYFVSMDNISLCFLGLTSEGKLNDEAQEAVEDIDILFVPVSKDTLEAGEAYKLAVSLEPKLIIPLGNEADIKAFVKEAGSEKPEKTEKLSLKKKDLDGKEGEIVLLGD